MNVGRVASLFSVEGEAMKKSYLLATLTIAVGALFTVGCDNGAAEKAQAQVRRIVADLDKRTTETGVYVRVKENELNEKDPWGTPVQISYADGGVAEIVMARSAGPDRQFFTNDDLVEQGMAANFKGLGEGIKKNAEETAANAAKGFVKGTVAGIKEALPKPKKQSDSEPKAPEGQPAAPSGRENPIE